MNNLIRQIPNLITLARGALGPIGGFILVQSAGAGSESEALLLGQIAAAMFVLAAFTDYLDGWLARHLHAESALGALLDPIADKLLVGGYLLAYCIISGYDAWLTLPVIVILGRDFIVTYARFAHPSPGSLHVTPTAKLKTALQMIVVALPFVLVAVGLTDIGLWYHYWIGSVWFLALLTAWSAMPYLRAAWLKSST